MRVLICVDAELGPYLNESIICRDLVRGQGISAGCLGYRVVYCAGIGYHV